MKRLMTPGGTGPETAAARKQDAAPDGLLVSRLDCEQYIVDLPPMSERQVEEALRYRVPALYPGKPGEAAIDHEANGSSSGSFLLFVMPARILESYRAAGLPLVSSVLLERKLAGRADRAFMLWTSDWVSYDRFSKGVLLESACVRRSGDVEADLGALLARLGAPSSVPVEVLAVDQAMAGLSDVTRLLEARGCADSVQISLSAAIAAVPSGSARIFPDAPRRQGRAGLALKLLVAANVLALVLCLVRYGDARSGSLAAAKREYDEALAKKGAALRLEEETAAMRKRYEALVSDRAPAMYDIISELAFALGDDTKIVDLLVKDGDFQLEARGRDALAALARLERAPHLVEVRLRQAVPDGGGGERFSLSGRYGHDEK